MPTADLAERFERNGEAGLRLRLHPGQQKAWRSKRRFILVLAGTQGGKTSFGPFWLAREIQSCGPGDYLAVTASYDLLQLKMLPALREHFCADLGWKYQAGDRVLASPEGDTRIIMRSAEAEGGLESATARAAWLDECGQPRFAVTAWEAVLRRLSIHQGRALLTTTPYEWNWLKTQHDRAVADPAWEIVRFRSVDNPAFPAEEYQRARRTMPDWRFGMFYDAEFTRPAGRIYDTFDDAVHVVDPFTVPKEWARIVGVDPGTSHAAYVWLAQHPDTGVYYAFREYLGGGHNAEDLAGRLLEYAEPVREWWGGARSEQDYRNRFALAGVPLALPVISEVEAGIDRVHALFTVGRLRVFRTLHGLIGQVISYSRELDDAGEPLDKIEHKERYHLCDALRYACCSAPIDFDAPKEAQPPPDDPRQRIVWDWEHREPDAAPDYVTDYL